MRSIKARRLRDTVIVFALCLAAMVAMVVLIAILVYGSFDAVPVSLLVILSSVALAGSGFLALVEYTRKDRR